MTAPRRPVEPPRRPNPGKPEAGPTRVDWLMVAFGGLFIFTLAVVLLVALIRAVA